MIFLTDLKRLYNRDLNFFEVTKIILLNTNIQCVGLYRLQDYFYTIKVPFLPKLLCYLNNVITGAEINLGVKIGKGLIIRHSNGIVIGNKTIIGENCTILHQVTFGEKYGDGTDELHQYPIIGDNVVVSAGAKIIGGVTVANNVVIGANAVVTKNIPENNLAVGVPARLIINKK